MEQIFTPDMIKENSISWTRKAEITRNGTTISVHQFKDEPADVWISNPTTYKRVAEGLTVQEAIDFANELLITF